MQWLRFYILKISLLLVGLTISLSACQKGGGSAGSGSSGGSPTVSPGETQTPAPVSPPVAQGGGSGGGGIDGSGGDSVHSSLEQVKQALAEEIRDLPQRLWTMTAEYKDSDDFVYDHKYSNGARKLVGQFLFPENSGAQDQRSDSPFRKNLETKAIQIKPQMEACLSKDGRRIGSARGNYRQGEICLSYQEMQKISPFNLNHEIFNLLIHELSHLSGFNEKQAVDIQTLVYLHRGMYSSYDDSGFINGLKSCDRKLIDQENEELRASAYWQSQIRRLIELLSGEQPRGCGEMTNKLTDRVDIFADDAEFLSGTAKFPDAGHDYRMDSKARSQAWMTTNRVQDISVVASISLETASAWIRLDAKMGTDAQCSPKKLLANLIANIPDVLQLGCNTRGDQVNTLDRVRNRIKKEKEILDGEPKLPQI